MTGIKSTASPHCFKPLHVRALFAVWLAWRNTPALRVVVNGLGILAIAAVIYVALVTVLSL